MLVVDATGHSQSIAAVLHGFATFDSGTRIAGVILNRVGSPRHEEVLRQACDVVGIPVLGAIPRDTVLSVPSRHLGLITAVEHGIQARAAVDAMTTLIARHVDIAAVAGLATAHVAAEPGIRSPRSGTRWARVRYWRWRAGGRSASATPNTPSCSAPQAPK